MPRLVMIWYTLAYLLLGFVALNSTLHIADAYSGFAFAIPMIGIPITLAITTWGIVTNIAKRNWLWALGYVGSCAGLYGLLRVIVS